MPGLILCFLIAGCGDAGNDNDMAGDMAAPDLSPSGPDLGCGGDLAGSQLQICGMPDAGFDRTQCRCVPDR